MNGFELHERLIGDYSSYIRSFIRIRDQRIDGPLTACLDAGVLWPDPLIQLNPSFRFTRTIDDLGADGILHRDCATIFRVGKDKGKDGITYLMDAVASVIETRLTAAYTAGILRKMGATSLKVALHEARKLICATD
jgi:hypothetical protein